MKKFRDFCLGQPFLTIVILSSAFVGTCMFAAAHLPSFLPRLGVMLALFLGALLFLRSRFHRGMQTAGRENMARFFARHPRANRAADLLAAPAYWWSRHGDRVFKLMMSALGAAFVVMTVRWIYIIKIAMPRDAAAFASAQQKKGEAMARDWPARKAAILAGMRREVDERRQRESEKEREHHAQPR